MGPIGCPETSVSNQRLALRNIPEERRSIYIAGKAWNRTHRSFARTGSQHNCVTTQQCHNTAVSQHNSVTTQCHNTALSQHKCHNTAVSQQCHNTAVTTQQCHNTAVSQYKCHNAAVSQHKSVTTQNLWFFSRGF